MTLEKGLLKAGAKKARIHAAAQAVFMKQGFEAASMDAIALAAGVSKPTLYRYYPNKEALFIGSLHQLLLEHQTSREIFARLREMPVDSLVNLEEALFAWAKVILENGLQPAYLALVRVLIAEIPRFPALGPLFSSAIPEEGRDILTSLFVRAGHQGVVSSDELDQAVRLFVGGVLTYLFGGLFKPDNLSQPPTPAQLKALVRLFLQGFATTSPPQKEQQLPQPLN